MSIVNSVKARRKDLGQMLKIGFGIIVDVFLATSMYNSDNSSNKILYGIMLLPFTLIIVSGAKGRRKLKRAYAMDSLLTSAHVIEVKISDIAEALGVRPKGLLKLMRKFMKKKIICNCELTDGEEPKLKLLIDTDVEEVEIECPSCGKVFTAKAGSSARCPDCASIINM